MTTKKELLKQIEELQKKADAMPDDDGVWFPNDWDSYYYICGEGVVHQAVWTSDSIDQHRLDFGNIYRTEKQAEIARDRRLAKVRVLRRIAELNAKQGWIYRESSQNNYYMTHTNHKFSFDWSREIKCLPTAYYGSKRTIETVMAEMENDYRLMLGGNE